MNRGMVSKFPISPDWLKGSTVMELINDRVPFVQPPLEYPNKMIYFASPFSRVLKGGVVYSLVLCYGSSKSIDFNFDSDDPEESSLAMQ
jgi:hypothetical protein